MAEENKTSLKVPAFSGKADDYAVWWRRFKAYGKVNQFGQCLKAEAETDLPNEDTDAAADSDPKKAARKRNGKAVLAFTLAFKTDGLMGIIIDSETTDYPDGLAWKIIDELQKRFKPEDKISRVQMTKLIHILVK